jgi:hypothetical protein
MLVNIIAAQRQSIHFTRKFSMKRALLGLILVIVLIIPFLFIQAADSVDDRGNPNDPAVNERANACYAGAALEGKCHTEDEWIAGWYLIRFQYGIFSRDEVPALYQWVLPTETTPATEEPLATPTKMPL